MFYRIISDLLLLRLTIYIHYYSPHVKSIIRMDSEGSQGSFHKQVYFCLVNVTWFWQPQIIQPIF